MAGWTSCRQYITLLWSFSTNSSAWSALHSFYCIPVVCRQTWDPLTIDYNHSKICTWVPTNLAWYQKEIRQQANNKTQRLCLHLLPLLWMAPWSQMWELTWSPFLISPPYLHMFSWHHQPQNTVTLRRLRWHGYKKLLPCWGNDVVPFWSH